MIAIESRMQGDHDELKILLQKCLISSHFNQKFSLQGGRISICIKIIAIKAVHPIRLRRFERLKWREIGGPQSHDVDSTSLQFRPFDLHRCILMKPHVPLRLAEYAIKSRP